MASSEVQNQATAAERVTWEPDDVQIFLPGELLPVVDDGEDESLVAAGDEPHTGAAIMAKVCPEDADRLAVDGGEDADELHMTLMYLGDAAGISQEEREAVVEALLHPLGELRATDGEIFAVSMFNPNGAEDGREPCVVGLVSGEWATLLHDTVLKAVNNVDGYYPPEQRSPWVAHVTLVYTDDADLSYFTDLVGPVRFDSVEVAFGEDRYEIPLRQADDGVSDVAEPSELPVGEDDAENSDDEEMRPVTDEPSVEYEGTLGFTEDGEPLVPNVLFDYAAWAKERDVNEPSGVGHQLREYWTHGPGAAKIRWGTDGSFDRCVRHLAKYVTRPQGLCAEYHHAATGEWPRGGIPSEGETSTFADAEAYPTVEHDEEGGEMPWHLEKRGEQFCVVKDADGSTVACHGDRGSAVAQVRALYASEPGAAANLNGGCPPGHHKMPDGSCMPGEDMDSYAGDAAAEPGTAPWNGVLTVEGLESGDGRMFAPGSLTWDAPPLPLMWQKETSHGGKSDVSVRVGSIDRVWREPDGGGRGDVNIIRGEGTLDLGNPDGAEVFRRMHKKLMGGDSVDVDSVKNADVELVYPEPEPLGEAAADGAPVLAPSPFQQPELTVYHRGRIRGTTLVEFPAFTEARLQLTDGDAVTAAADATFGVAPKHDTATTDAPWDAGAARRNLPSPLPVTKANDVFAYVDTSQEQDGSVPKSAGVLPHHEVSTDGSVGAANLTACSSAIGALHGAHGTGVSVPVAQRQAVYDHLAAHLRDAGRTPPPFSLVDRRIAALTAATSVIEVTDAPPREWFDEPTDVDALGALTVTAAGRVYGWLAPAGVRHRSFGHKAQYVPLGNVDYSRFLGGETIVADGGRVVTGNITLGCGHASTSYGVDAQAAADHYDNACSIVATARVGESPRGVWIAGALMPGVEATQVRKMMACSLSGDWRPHLDRPGWREFVAALLVPVPGFPMARVAPSVTISEGQLVAAAVPVQLAALSGRPTHPVDHRAKALAVAARLGRDPESRAAARTTQVASLRDRVRS